MTKDNKTKKQYSPPIELAARDIISIKTKAAEQALLQPQYEIGIFEFVEDTYNKSYPKDLRNFIDKAKKTRDGDFYIIVGSKVDPLLNMLWVKNGKIIMTDAGKCPTPMPGTHVYHYKHRDDTYTLLWALPDEFNIRIIKDNIIDVSDILKDLIAYIYDYEDGTLHRLRDKLNGVDPNKKIENKKLDLNKLTDVQIEALSELGKLKQETDKTNLR